MAKLITTPFTIQGIDIWTLPPRPEFGARVLQAADNLTSNSNPKQTICDIRHPDYYDCNLIRQCWQSDDTFLFRHLHRFSRREHARDFYRRRAMTPVPSFARAAIIELINRLSQRLVDVTRSGGSQSYLDAAAGLQGGVDNSNSSMNWFVRRHVLPELLPIGAVAVYVDNSPATGPTLADTTGHPYLYSYHREDILSWAYNQDHCLTQVLLRDYLPVLDPTTLLPIDYEIQYRFVYLKETVSIAFFDEDGAHKSTIDLALTALPVHIYQLSEPLMASVARHQIALLNLESSDISQLLNSYPLYTEQRDFRFETSHLKSTNLPDDVVAAVPDTFPDSPSDNTIKAGPAYGRIYGSGLNAPSYVAPPTGPVEASIKKQQALKDDIRSLLNLAVGNIKSASVESRSKGDEPTEAGLVAIGTELEHGERAIARIWAEYEASSPTTIQYPTFYYVKPDEERINEAKAMAAHLDDVPSITFRRSMQFEIAKTLLQNKISDTDLEKIASELLDAKVPTANGAELIKDVQEGLVSHETASQARGYPKEELGLVEKEYAARLAAIAVTQVKNPNPIQPVNPTGLDPTTNNSNNSNQLTNPAARGVPDLAPNPSVAAAQEKVGAPRRGPDNLPRT